MTFVNEYLSEHFRWPEFQCPCCGEAVIDRALIEALEEFRMRVGRPVIINSGYRCPQHNHSIGSALTSQHIIGRAADVRVAGLTVYDLKEIAQNVTRFAHGGIGLYPKKNFIHLDVRRGPARWDES